MRRMTRASRIAACAVVVLLSPSIARADWMAGAFLGAAMTRPNTLRLEQPAAGTRVDIAHVRYEGRSFESPPYYGYRLGRLFQRGAGLEAEFIHLKAYARTAETVSLSGRVRDVETNTATPLGGTIQHFSMSHGLNLVLANLTWPLVRSGALTIRARGGGGLAVPHAESAVDGVFQEQYQVTSAAFQAGASAEVRVAGRIRAVAEYKLTATRPEVDVPGGTIEGRFVSHHVAFGIAIHSR